MKRILSAVLICLMLLSMTQAFAYSATDRPHTHVWHDDYFDLYQAPTCTENGYYTRWCEICYKQERVTMWAMGHDWGGWKTIKAATCTSSGTDQRTCARCGATEEKTIGALGHDYVVIEVLTEATCTEQSYERRKCTRCGRIDEQFGLKKPHDWSAWYVVVEATLFSAGVEERKCSMCGETEQRDFYPPGTLKEGDRGDAVKLLQEALNAAGYDCGAADGSYGPKTAAAVSKLEEDNGIKPDGIAWPGVQAMLTGTEADELTVDVDIDAPANAPATLGDTVTVKITLTNTGNVNSPQTATISRTTWATITRRAAPCSSPASRTS